MRFTLMVRPDGQAVLATASRLSPDEALRLGGILREWEEGKIRTLVVPECDVVQIVALEVDLEAGSGVRVAEGVSS